jgi:uncharacterized membrane-anchored protein
MSLADVIRKPLGREPLAAKVPEIMALFWVIKILTTGMGEAASDFLANTSLALGALVGIGGFAWALWRQLLAPRYEAVTYWAAVAMVAVFGTIMADGPHKATNLSYWYTSVFYALVLAGIFVWWYRSEGTLSIHSITTGRRERFYWATVLATFALGTAVGDLTGLTLHWGFFASGLLFTAAILMPLIGWKLGLNSTVAFWWAYILTRPLGASFADWLAKPSVKGGGLGYGDGLVTLVTLALIAVLVAYLAIRRPDIQAEPAGERATPVLDPDEEFELLADLRTRPASSS